MKKILSLFLLALPALGADTNGTLQRVTITTSQFAREINTNETAALWRAKLGLGGTNGFLTDVNTNQFVMVNSQLNIKTNAVIYFPIFPGATVGYLWTATNVNGMGEWRVGASSFSGSSNVVSSLTAGTNVNIQTTVYPTGQVAVINAEVSRGEVLTVSSNQARLATNALAGSVASAIVSATNHIQKTQYTTNDTATVTGIITDLINAAFDPSAFISTNLTIATTAPLAGGGALNHNLTLSMPPAGSGTNGYLLSNDWAFFYAKQPFSATLSNLANTGAFTNQLGASNGIAFYTNGNTVYIGALASSGSSNGVWGLITGTITDQSDLVQYVNTLTGVIATNGTTKLYVFTSTGTNAIRNISTNTANVLYQPIGVFPAFMLTNGQVGNVRATGNLIVSNAGVETVILSNQVITPTLTAEAATTTTLTVDGNSVMNGSLAVDLSLSVAGNTLVEGLSAHQNISSSQTNFALWFWQSNAATRAEHVIRKNEYDAGTNAVVGLINALGANSGAVLTNSYGSTPSGLAVYVGPLTLGNVYFGGSASDTINFTDWEANVGGGAEAMALNINGTANTFWGDDVMVGNVSGSQNVAIGASALRGNTSGNRSTALGANTLMLNTTSQTNVAIGFNAGSSNIIGHNNVYIANVGQQYETNTIRIGATNHNTIFEGAITGNGIGLTNVQTRQVQYNENTFDINFEYRTNENPWVTDFPPLGNKFTYYSTTATSNQLWLTNGAIRATTNNATAFHYMPRVTQQPVLRATARVMYSTNGQTSGNDTINDAVYLLVIQKPIHHSNVSGQTNWFWHAGFTMTGIGTSITSNFLEGVVYTKSSGTLPEDKRPKSGEWVDIGWEVYAGSYSNFHMWQGNVDLYGSCPFLTNLFFPGSGFATNFVFEMTAGVATWSFPHVQGVSYSTTPHGSWPLGIIPNMDGIYMREPAIVGSNLTVNGLGIMNGKLVVHGIQTNRERLIIDVADGTPALHLSPNSHGGGARVSFWKSGNDGIFNPKTGGGFAFNNSNNSANLFTIGQTGNTRTFGNHTTVGTSSNAPATTDNETPTYGQLRSASNSLTLRVSTNSTSVAYPATNINFVGSGVGWASNDGPGNVTVNITGGSSGSGVLSIQTNGVQALSTPATNLNFVGTGGATVTVSSNSGSATITVIGGTGGTAQGSVAWTVATNFAVTMDEGNIFLRQTNKFGHDLRVDFVLTGTGDEPSTDEIWTNGVFYAKIGTENSASDSTSHPNLTFTLRPNEYFQLTNTSGTDPGTVRSCIGWRGDVTNINVTLASNITATTATIGTLTLLQNPDAWQNAVNSFTNELKLKSAITFSNNYANAGGAGNPDMQVSRRNGQAFVQGLVTKSSGTTTDTELMMKLPEVWSPEFLSQFSANCTTGTATLVVGGVSHNTNGTVALRMTTGLGYTARLDWSYPSPPSFHVVTNSILGASSLLIPDGCYGSKTLVCFAHGAGANQDFCFVQTNLFTNLVAGIAKAGYPVLAATTIPFNWGNTTNITNWAATIAWVTNTFPVTNIVFFGSSMGGQSTLNTMVNLMPWVQNWIGYKAVYSLTNASQQASLVQNLTNAYPGAVAGGGAVWTNATWGFDPSLASNTNWTGKRFLAIVSTNDTLIDPVFHSFALTNAAHQGGCAYAKAFSYPGDHTDPTASLALPTILQFIQGQNP